MANETEGTQAQKPDPAATESRAREMGWVPKEEFRGDQTKWIDAPAYVERGESMLPIMQANNRRLISEVQSLRTQLTQASQANQEIRQSVEELREFTGTMAKANARASRAEIAKKIKAAREAGDVELELELQDELTEANRTVRGEGEQRQNGSQGNQSSQGGPPPRQRPEENPEFIAWQQANPWFGGADDKDVTKTNFALATAQSLRSRRADLKGKAFFEEVDREVSAVFGGNQRRQAPNKVETGNGSGRQGGGSASDGGKTFSDLPADAQATCRAQARRFVGENKAFKTEAEWQNHYVSKYFERD